MVAVDGSWRVETSLTISISDVNDNAPVFAQSIFLFRLQDSMIVSVVVKYTDGCSVAEGQPALALVGRVVATDADEANSRNSRLSFHLPGPASDLFSLDAASGELRTLKTLRFTPDAADNTHQISVIARDDGRPRLQSEARVLVRVTQANNFAPIFPRLRYQVAVTADAPLGSLLLHAPAFDKDQGANGEVVYGLVGATDVASLFAVDEEGNVRSDAEMGPEGSRFELQLTAEDQGSPPLKTSAHLRSTPCLSAFGR